MSRNAWKNEWNPNESSKNLDYQCKEMNIHIHIQSTPLFSRTFSSLANNVLHVNTFNIIILYRKISKLLDSFNPRELMFHFNYFFWVHHSDIAALFAAAHMLQYHPSEQFHGPKSYQQHHYLIQYRWTVMRLSLTLTMCVCNFESVLPFNMNWLAKF